MSEKVIEFEVISKLINSVTIKGYVNIDEIDDENPLRFYDHQGLECESYVPPNPYKNGVMLWNDAYEELSYSFQSDEIFLQFLSDYSDEDKTVDRGEYLLKINDGRL